MAPWYATVITQWPGLKWCCLAKRTSLRTKDKLLSWSYMILRAKKNTQQGREANLFRFTKLQGGRLLKETSIIYKLITPTQKKVLVTLHSSVFTPSMCRPYYTLQKILVLGFIVFFKLLYWFTILQRQWVESKNIHCYVSLLAFSLSYAMRFVLKGRTLRLICRKWVP